MVIYEGKQWIVKAHCEEGVPEEGKHFELQQQRVDSDNLAEGQILVKTLLISVDPYMRIRMNPAMVKQASYFPAYELGKPMVGGTTGKVLASRSGKFSVGDIVTVLGPWAEYAILSEKLAKKYEFAAEFPLEYSLSLLGMPGLTAFHGLEEIGCPKAGETVLVSAAAGAVGSAACMFAKQRGCRVVGIAGGADKIAYLRNELHCDDTIDYKSEEGKDMTAAVRRACPDGLDIYFDNVGGETLDAAIINMKEKARLILCGSITTYGKKSDQGPRLNFLFVARNAKMEGFLVSRYADKDQEALKQMTTWLREGKLKGYKLEVDDGIQNTIKSFQKLFVETKIGKKLVRVSKD